MTPVLPIIDLDAITAAHIKVDVEADVLGAVHLDIR